MARPKTPKLPVSKTLISEVLQRVSNAKNKTEKVDILREYRSPALTKILICNFAKSVTFMFPDTLHCCRGTRRYQSSDVNS